jgi:ubiquitin-associated and SH3 domain-containing protein
LPRRRNPLRDFIGDSPITEIGASQARLTGEALAANECLAQCCYSSPSFRCIQTAHCLLQGRRNASDEHRQERDESVLGMGIEDRVKIRIEPGLFEFLGWYERGLPSFFSSANVIPIDDEQMSMFNIDKNYRPIIPLEKLSRDEKYIDYYNRSFKVTQQITDKHKLTGILSRDVARVDRLLDADSRRQHFLRRSCGHIGSVHASTLLVVAAILFRVQQCHPESLLSRPSTV